TSGVDDDHVFISSGENVRLPCNNALPDCKSTTWNYNRFRDSAAVELIGLGIKKKDTESHERLSLGSDCSLNIKNVTKEDYGYYTCQQWTGHQKQANDRYVYLHVLHVSSSSSQTEISAGSSVTLSCQLYSYTGVSCGDSGRSEGVDLLWVNQAGDKLKISDSRYQISAPGHCIITLTTTLLNEDDNKEWRCEVTQGDQVKTSVTYTVKISDKDKTTTAVTPVQTTSSQDPSTTKSSETKAQDTTTTAVNKVSTTNPNKPSTTKSSETKAQDKTMTAVNPVHITDSQDPSTTKSPETKGSSSLLVISVSVAAFAVFLLVVFWLIWRKRAVNKRGTDGSSVKDENEDKGTYETINMSIPAAARDNTDNVTYSEVSSSGKKPVKSLTDPSVTYAAIR
ncbi:hypothetical protein QQF64_025933, partial [Cirrhinus molitorella]